jgi:hypothetical protein
MSEVLRPPTRARAARAGDADRYMEAMVTLHRLSLAEWKDC